VDDGYGSINIVGKYNDIFVICLDVKRTVRRDRRIYTTYIHYEYGKAEKTKNTMSLSSSYIFYIHILPPTHQPGPVIFSPSPCDDAMPSPFPASRSAPSRFNTRFD